MRSYEQFLETEVLTADPLTLVRMLYRGAVESVAAARRQMAAGEIAGRCRSIVKAHAIILELSSSLDASQGAEVAHNLRELYDYMQRRLNDANIEQSDAPLAEVERILGSLLEAWQDLAETAAAPAAAITPHPESARVSYAG